MTWLFPGLANSIVWHVVVITASWIYLKVLVRLITSGRFMKLGFGGQVTAVIVGIYLGGFVVELIVPHLPPLFAVLLRLADLVASFGSLLWVYDQDDKRGMREAEEAYLREFEEEYQQDEELDLDPDHQDDLDDSIVGDEAA